jgi:hypothetical protein
MEEKILFRPAKIHEVQAVFDLIMERVAWMDTVGIRQWNTTKYGERYPLSYYEEKRQMGELFLLEDTTKGEILAVGALFYEDARWPEKANARYLHHFASRVDKKGIGSIFLAEAESYIAKEGAEYMRLDSAVGNTTLEQYYTARGYAEAGYCEDGLYRGILRQKKLR